jgi:hypothetical protein
MLVSAELHRAGVRYVCVGCLPSTSLLQPILRAQSSRRRSHWRITPDQSGSRHAVAG